MEKRLKVDADDADNKHNRHQAKTTKGWGLKTNDADDADSCCSYIKYRE
jgi:hypothetical protein